MHNVLRAAVSTLLVAAFFFPPESANAQSAERLQIHGFITQGLGQSGNKLGVAGLGEHATWDYRTAALQFGYQISDNERFVLQLGNRRLAHNPLNETLSDVFVDWGFVQSRFGGVSVRAGKIPMPRGIFNQIRDVGTLLPFYRAPLSFYTEGVETLDGVTAARSIDLGGAWELDATAFLGSWSFVQVQPEEGEHNEHGELEASQLVTETRAQGVAGGQVWLNTPVRGLRLGFGGQRFAIENVGLRGFFGAEHGGHGEEEEEEEEAEHSLGGFLWQVSLDGSFDQFTLRGEYQIFNLAAMTYYAGYAQVGFQLTDRFSAHVQGESSRVNHVDDEGTLAFQHTRDLGTSINFKVTPALVVKVEGHLRGGHAFDTYVDPARAGKSSKYFIASASVAF